MKIGINAKVLSGEAIKGMGIYLANLLDSISRFDGENNYILYYDSRQNPNSPCLKLNEKFISKGISVKKGDRFYFWEQLSLHNAIIKDRINILHCPSNTMPFFSTKPTVVTVHDTIAQEMPKKRIWDRFYFNWFQLRALRKAVKIITPSAYSKNKIIKVMKIPGHKIEIIPNGISSSFRILEDRSLIEKTLKRLNVARPYILNVGGESPWKNVSRLIEAYALLVKEHNIKEQLVITGIRKKSILDGHLKETEKLKLSNKVKILGYVDESNLVALYNGAEMFVYPSLMEGFGLPPLEAMACRTPVAASNATSIPEIVGDAALLFNGKDVEQMAEKIYTLLIDENLKSKLRKKGLEHVKKYSWDETARKTLMVYAEAAGMTNNILYYETGSGFGGSTNAVANLINRVNRNKFTPVLAIKHYGPMLGGLERCDVIKLKDYHRLSKDLNTLVYTFFNGLMEIITLYRLIKKRKIALVHINVNPMSALPAAIASKMAGVPCICHLRQTRSLIKREKGLVSCVDKFIVLNKKAYDIYKRDILEEKLVLVHDGVNLEEFSNVTRGIFRKEMNLNSSQVIGLVGRIVKGKGQKEFILAAKEVLKTKPGAKFVITGDAAGEKDGYFEEVMELVKKEGMSEKVAFTGWRKDIKSVIADFDILIQASTTFPEGFGLTLIEAMALGKPVIATDIPGPSDIIRSGETGFLIPPGDVHAMAEKIEYLLNNPAVCMKTGEAGRIDVKKRFDIKNTVSQVESIYDQLLADKQTLA